MADPAHPHLPLPAGNRPLILSTPDAAAAFAQVLDAPATVNERLAAALARPPRFGWIDG